MLIRQFEVIAKVEYGQDADDWKVSTVPLLPLSAPSRLGLLLRVCNTIRSTFLLALQLVIFVASGEC